MNTVSTPKPLVKSKMVLHYHNSIPNYLDNLDEGCSICESNQKIKLSVKEVVSDCCKDHIDVKQGSHGIFMFCSKCGYPCQVDLSNPSETNEASVESVSQPKAVDGYLKEFEKVFWGSGATLKEIDTLWKMLQPYLKSSIERARREGVNQERERWINQPANQHDEEIRKVERQRVVEMLRKLKRTGQCTCMEDYSSCPYNIALSDVKEHLNLPSDKETI